MSLATGVNTILIQVTTACGTSSKSISITRTIPCQTIITNLISPAAGTVTVMDPAYSIVLHATGLTNVGQIAATLNGVTVTPTFDAVSGNISLTSLTLVDGENTVAVGMTNACSKASVSYKIIYNGCQPPIIVFNSIYPGMVVSDAVYNLSAVITNVSDASDLVLKVNGKVFLLLPLNSHPIQFNVKCDPERAIILREENASIIPGYHMNKKHWNTIILDGTIPTSLILELVDHSYELVISSVKKGKKK
jgi:predicted DNA-binding protein (MmcQ/YjbR family)